VVGKLLELAGDVGVAYRVRRNAKAPIATAAAQVSGIHQAQIDRKPPLTIIAGQLETYHMAVPKRITAGYPPPRAANVLVDDGLVFDNLATRNAYNQVAASTKRQPLGAVEVEFNLPRGRRPAQLRNRIPLSLVAVVNQVHAWIYLRVSHPGVVRYVGAPFPRIIADEVIALARQLLHSRYIRPGVGAYQPHAQHRVRCLRAVVPRAIADERCRVQPADR
jgi:hypothetical protein